MGWIPLAELSVWFDLNKVPKSNRSWYYNGIYAVEGAYLNAKAETMKK